MAPPDTSLPQMSSPLGLALALSMVFALLYIVNSYITAPYPKGVALLREPPGAKRFSWRTRLAYYTDCTTLYREAYHQVSYRGTTIDSWHEPLVGIERSADL